jgi:hypothetical protein
MTLGEGLAGDFFAGFGFTSHCSFFSAGCVRFSPVRKRALNRAASMLRTLASQACRSDILRTRCSCS